MRERRVVVLVVTAFHVAVEVDLHFRWILVSVKVVVFAWYLYHLLWCAI